MTPDRGQQNSWESRDSLCFPHCSHTDFRETQSPTCSWEEDNKSLAWPHRQPGPCLPVQAHHLPLSLALCILSPSQQALGHAISSTQPLLSPTCQTSTCATDLRSAVTSGEPVLASQTQSESPLKPSHSTRNCCSRAHIWLLHLHVLAW